MQDLETYNHTRPRLPLLSMAHSVPVGAKGSGVAEMRPVAVGSPSEVAGRGTHSSGSTQLVCETALWACEPSSEDSRPERAIGKLSTDGWGTEGRRPERSFWSLSIEGWAL